MADEPTPVFNSFSKPADQADTLIRGFGIALLIAFFFPVIGDKILFISISGLWEKGVPDILRIEILYPLIAGAALISLARKARSVGRAAWILAIGAFPFLLLLVNGEVRSGLAEITKGLPGSGSMGANLVLSGLAAFAILSGAYASRVRPEQALGAHVAVAGAGLYFITLFIPVNKQFPLIAPFKMMVAHDPTKYGVMFISGLVVLACMALVILACLRCFRLPGPAAEREKTGTAVLKLWFAQFYVYGAFLAYGLIISLAQGRGESGTMVLAFLTTLGKFGVWIIGLFLLIPLGIAEMIIAGARPEAKPSPAVEGGKPEPAVEPAAGEK
jgi:hypothetical protein